MSSIPPRRVAALRGRVIQDTYAKDSKSERNAIFIESSDQRYILRRKTGPVFGDTELNQYVGHQVECSGFISGGTLLADQITVV